MRCQLRADVLKDGQQVIHRLCAEHGDAGLTEIGDAFEQGRSSEVATGMEDTSLLVDTSNIDAQLFDKDIQFGVEVKNHGDRAAVLRRLCTDRPVPLILIEIIAHLFEDPWASEGGATYHDGIYAIGIEGCLSLLC